MSTRMFNTEDRDVGAVKKPLPSTHLLVTHGLLQLHLQHLFPDTKIEAEFCMIMTKREGKNSP